MSTATSERPDLKLESPGTGKVPPGVVEELKNLRTRANGAVTLFREAVKVQADKHKVKPAALRRYVVALGNDKVDELKAEAVDIEALVGVA